MADMTSNIKVKCSIQQGLTAATVNGLPIDADGFGEAMIIGQSAVTGAGTTSIWKLQEGNLANGSDAIDVPTGVLSTSTGVGNYTKLMNVNLDKRKRYLRLVHTGAGASAGGYITGMILLGDPVMMPVVQDVPPLVILKEAIKDAAEGRPPAEGGPVLLSINPTSAVIGTPGDFEVYCNGSGFTPESVIVWNHGDELTDFVSGNQIHTTVTTATMVNPVILPVQVRNADGKITEPQYFEVLPPEGR